MLNISMFLKLRTCIRKGKVKMPSDYKHLDYMLSKNWITRNITDFKNESTKGLFFMIPQYDDYATITKEGEDKYYSVRNSWLKWIITSVIAIISASAAIIGTLLKLLP